MHSLIHRVRELTGTQALPETFVDGGSSAGDQIALGIIQIPDFTD